MGNRPREGHPRNNQHSPPGVATLSQGPGTVTSWKGCVRPGRGAPMGALCSPSVWGRKPSWLSPQGRGAGCVCPESVALWPSCPRSCVQSGVSAVCVPLATRPFCQLLCTVLGDLGQV